MRRGASSGCTHRSVRRRRRVARLRGPTARSQGWCPRRSRRSSSRRADRRRPESARGRSATRRSPSQAARRSAGPRQRGPVPAEPSRQGCRSEEHTSELQSRRDLVCRLLLEKKKKKTYYFFFKKKKKKKKYI